MKLDPAKYYRMPLAMGPVFDRKELKIVYPQVELLGFQYLTDPEALEDLLPDCYHPGKEPLVTILFSENNGLDFMGGGGYRFASVMVSARFDGKQDHVEGDYIVVMFDNNTWSIISGREDLGIPKVYADISNIKLMPDGHRRCEASLAGHLLFGLDVLPMKGQLGIVRAVAARQYNSRPFLGYKYIPSLDGPPDADYPTITYNTARLEKLATGKKATLRFGVARYEDIGVAKNLMDALATLTIIRPVQAVHFTGSVVLRADLSRRLR